MKKVLLMGRDGAGKSSMRSIIFANYLATDTNSLGPTMEVEHTNVKFLGNLNLNIWDCGGQKAFMESYFTSQKENIFRNVGVLIHVFDVQSDNAQNDMDTFRATVEALLQYSKDAKVFCLVHKMDLVPEDKSDRIFNKKEADICKIALPMKVTCFRTSIWDETLYLAWSSIVYSLIPNVENVEQQLRQFCGVCEADEVLLFERATFLVISHANRKPHADIHRFEKISNIMKQFKLSCGKMGSAFTTMEVRNSRFSAFIDGLTPHTFVMVVLSDPDIQASTVRINIRGVRGHFEQLFVADEGAIF